MEDFGVMKVIIVKTNSYCQMSTEPKAPAIYSGSDNIYHPFDFVIYESIQKFNQHHDIHRLFSMVTEVYTRSNSFCISKDNSLKKMDI